MRNESENGGHGRESNPTSSAIAAAALTSELHTIPMAYRNYCGCDFPFKQVSCISESGNLRLVELDKLNFNDYLYFFQAMDTYHS